MKKPCVWVVEEKFVGIEWTTCILRFARALARDENKIQKRISPNRKFRITKYAPANPFK